MVKGSAKGRCGLLLMVELALQAGRGTVLVADIAERQALPVKFLRVLLGSLKAAGLVTVQRGPSGGCERTRRPSHTTAPAAPPSPTWPTGTRRWRWTARGPRSDACWSLAWR